jgi:nucleotide-binding universal stress UspA family protein
MYASIVVGTDGSATAQHAVDQAAALARLTGAHLHVVSACSTVDPLLAASASASIGMPMIQTTGAVDDQLEATGAMLEELVGKLTADGLGVTSHRRQGSAAHALVDVAKAVRADLLVVGSKGMTGVRRLLGSVPNTVAHQAECSVLVVKTD